MHTHLASFLQEGQKHRGTCSSGTDDKERKESLSWERIWLALTEPASPKEARFFPYWSSIRNVGFYMIHEMNTLGHINMEI